MQTATRSPGATLRASADKFKLTPVADNAYRLLGLSCHASQREIYAAAASLRRAIKLGVAERPHAHDISWLGAAERTENGVRDCLGRLTVPAQRIYERLFWFFDAQTAAAAMPGAPSLASLEETAARIRASENASARHDCALLRLAGLLRLDPAFELGEEWRQTYALWKEVVETREFWSSLMAADLKGDFEQATTFAEISDLRQRTWRLVTAPVAETAKDAILGEDRQHAARALAVLNTSPLPQTLRHEYEQEILGPVEDEFDVLLAMTFMTYRYEVKTNQSIGERRETCWRAHAKFNEQIRPALKKILELAGAESQVARRIYAAAAEMLDELADGFESAFDRETRVKMLRKAWQLAPPESAALLTIEEHLDAARDSGERPQKTVEGYARQLAAALREPPAQAELFTSYIQQGETEKKLARWGRGAWRFVLFVVFALVVAKCFNSLPGSRRTAFQPVNFNFPTPTLAPMTMPQFKRTDFVVSVTASELQSKLKAKSATVFHVGAKDEYDAGHIPGALWMPETEMASRVRRLSKFRQIVLYCDCGAVEEASRRAAVELQTLGFIAVSVLEGGYQSWVDAGLPVVPAAPSIVPPKQIEATKAPPRALQ
ncbi:MAG TPA: rhodanese-like domain-containing protein [Pyrinomonadaceae bacterium]|nr:rhodanese-like domain-containing protein [Pyrinomonadaceae bacterium]